MSQWIALTRQLVSSPHRYCQNASPLPRILPRGCLFQALIGTAKTTSGTDSAGHRSRVSSPHRYCQNDRHVRLPAQRSHVSSPHRYCQNGVWPAEEWLEQSVSSPHRYCQNFNAMNRALSPYEVSSPHRYCQNSQRRENRVLSSWFQALIGTAKTPGHW